MSEILFLIVLTAIAAGIAYDSGEQIGMQNLHRGKYQCQTLPDDSIHCWKVKTKI